MEDPRAGIMFHKQYSNKVWFTIAKQRGERHKGRRKVSTGGTTPASKLKFVAPNSGHKDVYFTTGSTKEPVAFQDTVQKLARHLSTPAGRKQGPTLGKAMTDPKDPMCDPPTRLVQKYYKNTNGTETRDWVTGGTKNVAVMDDLD